MFYTYLRFALYSHIANYDNLSVHMYRNTWKRQKLVNLQPRKLNNIIFPEDTKKKIIFCTGISMWMENGRSLKVMSSDPNALTCHYHHNLQSKQNQLCSYVSPLTRLSTNA